MEVWNVSIILLFINKSLVVHNKKEYAMPRAGTLPSKYMNHVMKPVTTLQKLNGCFDLAVIILVAVLSDTQDAYHSG